MGNFNTMRLMNITEEQKWEQAYNEEVRKLWNLAERQTNLVFDMYVNGIQSEEMQEVSSVIPGIASQPGFIDSLKMWEEKVNDSILKGRLKKMIARLSEEISTNDPEVLKLSGDLQEEYMQRVFKIDGEDYNIGTIYNNLLSNPDRSLRKKLKFAADDFAREMAPRVRELFEKRNKLAVRNGYNNYFDFKFRSAGLDWDQYKKECMDILEGSKNFSTEFEKKVKVLYDMEEICSYDYNYLSLNSMSLKEKNSNKDYVIPAIRDIFDSFGLHMDESRFKVTLANMPFSGFADASSPKNINIILSPREGSTFFNSVFHELGHALYFLLSDDKYYELYHCFDIIDTEAMAEIFSVIASQKEWLIKNFDVTDEAYAEYIDFQRWSTLNVIKYFIYNSFIENELYSNIDADPEEIANRMYSLVYGNEEKVSHPFADFSLISTPVYVQSYIYALGVREMLFNKFNTRGLYGKRDEFETIRKHYMFPAYSLSWREKVENICGEKFTFKYIGKYICGK